MQKFIFRRDLLAQQSTYPCYLKRYRISSPFSSNNKTHTYKNNYTDHSKTQTYQFCWDQPNGINKYPDAQKKQKENIIDSNWIKKMSVKTHNNSKARNIKTALFGNSINSNSIIHQKRSIDRFQDLYGNTIDFPYIKKKWIKMTKQLKHQQLSVSRSKSSKSEKIKQSKTAQQRKRHKVLKKNFKNCPSVGDYQVNMDFTGKKIIRNVDFSIKAHDKRRKHQSGVISSNSDEQFSNINQQLKRKSKNNIKKEKNMQCFENAAPNNKNLKAVIEIEKMKTNHVPMNEAEMNKVWLTTLKKYKISQANFMCSHAPTD